MKTTSFAARQRRKLVLNDFRRAQRFLADWRLRNSQAARCAVRPEILHQVIDQSLALFALDESRHADPIVKIIKRLALRSRFYKQVTNPPR